MEAPYPCVQFQFTHPRRGATEDERGDFECLEVSIHAPQEGCDVCNVR